MIHLDRVFIGVDIGTQGVRGIVITDQGVILDSCSESYTRINIADQPEKKEQNPEDWWRAVQNVLKRLSTIRAEIAAVAFDGTSGTIVPIDNGNVPLMNGIMYNDARAVMQAARLESAAGEHEKQHGYCFNASFALPKIIWCEENGIKASRYIHQTDYIVGKLTGIYDITDMSNALKTGYDLIQECWPAFIEKYVHRTKLPKVVPCGSVIGTVNNYGAEMTGLRKGTIVCAGATDGYASALAACAVSPGDWASIIGTTLILKGISKKLITEPNGVIYSHKHPQGWWMPGGASNVGGRCLNEWFGEEKFKKLDQMTIKSEPTGDLVYPLLTPGERFPFVRSDFTGFRVEKDGNSNEARSYMATLEGVGYVERMCYDLLSSLGCEISETIYTTGGASKSFAWLQIRANILNRTLKVPVSTDAATGSAMLSASSLHFSNLVEAVASMGSIRAVIEPQQHKVKIYNEIYETFLIEINERLRQSS